MEQPTWRPGALVEEFKITHERLGELKGYLHRTSARYSGRRILVRDLNGKLLADTDDCYDVGNAINSLQHKLNAL